VAEGVTPLVLEWLEKNGNKKEWFLHVNYWDVHVPYRTPEGFRSPFEDEPPVSWMNEDLFADYVGRPGLRSFMDTFFSRDIRDETEVQSKEIDSIESFKKMYNSYDTSILYTDQHLGRIFEKLERLGLLKETAIIVTADHGEDLGEMGSIGHGFASNSTGNIPFVLYWPGMTEKREDTDYHYQFDLAATILNLLEIDVPEIWDGKSFASDLEKEKQSGRDYLVLSQLAQAHQRSVLFRSRGEEFLFSQTWSDMLHNYPERMLFNLTNDPHTINDLATEEDALVEHAEGLLERWGTEMSASSSREDPLLDALEDGPSYLKKDMNEYLERLRNTGRTGWERQYWSVIS
jgi:arylsulfatase A-like enzyme